ncbi:Hypothetical predicted protein [Octopus vulgaris]|uniref:Uncharacterized protein n=1 Tax=Octopus vulgaris TaxID=6645 RepID=A0AA36AJT2_OCTVU|nr:Hypothetical predicted protein [Octopus vulgaris]
MPSIRRKELRMGPDEVKCRIPKKTVKSAVWIILLVFTNIIYPCNGLRCWKCISENCHQLDPNAEAMTVVCKKGQSCLKVIYQLGRLFPRYKSIVSNHNQDVSHKAASGTSSQTGKIYLVAVVQLFCGRFQPIRAGDI